MGPYLVGLLIPLPLLPLLLLLLPDDGEEETEGEEGVEGEGVAGEGGGLVGEGVGPSTPVEALTPLSSSKTTGQPSGQTSERDAPAFLAMR